AADQQSRAAKLVDQFRFAGDGFAVRRRPKRCEDIDLISRRQNQEDTDTTRWKARVRVVNCFEKCQTWKRDIGSQDSSRRYDCGSCSAGEGAGEWQVPGRNPR